LQGLERGRDGVGLLVHLVGVGAELLPHTLHDAELRAGDAIATTAPGDSTNVAAQLSCVLQAQGQRFALDAVSLTIHRDLQAIAEAAIAPRAVRWRTRLLWRLVFLLMRFRFGQRLLLRRYSR
jgi:hypothetical protein